MLLPPAVHNMVDIHNLTIASCTRNASYSSQISCSNCHILHLPPPLRTQISTAQHGRRRQRPSLLHLRNLRHGLSPPSKPPSSVRTKAIPPPPSHPLVILLEPSPINHRPPLPTLRLLKQQQRLIRRTHLHRRARARDDDDRSSRSFRVGYDSLWAYDGMEKVGRYIAARFRWRAEVEGQGVGCCLVPLRRHPQA